jgi:hypothetical protein
LPLPSPGSAYRIDHSPAVAVLVDYRKAGENLSIWSREFFLDVATRIKIVY